MAVNSQAKLPSNEHHCCSLKAATVSTLTEESGKEFHSGIVCGKKKEFLNCSVHTRKCLYLWSCLFLVRESAVTREPSACTATLPLMILNKKVRRISPFHEEQPKSQPMLPPHAQAPPAAVPRWVDKRITKLALSMRCNFLQAAAKTKN